MSRRMRHGTCRTPDFTQEASSVPWALARSPLVLITLLAAPARAHGGSQANNAGDHQEDPGAESAYSQEDSTDEKECDTGGRPDFFEPRKVHRGDDGNRTRTISLED